ncbi:hypothetical protein WDZ11_00115 (plasmid) [Roseomonas mucosa]|uniref:hypothetical protein n=1 Tax=Roseomonas mucosa TaxID=207340 RepID=UPI0030D568E8
MDSPPRHIRTRIRDAAAAALVAGVPGVAGRVFPGRSGTLYERELPCLLVHTPHDVVETLAYGKGTTVEQRRTDLRVFVAVAEVEDADAWRLADDIGADVEMLLGAPKALAAAGVKSTTLHGCIGHQDDESEVPVLLLEMRFSTLSIAAAGRPGEAR